MADNDYYASTAASLLIPVLPDNQGKTIRWYALSVALIDLAPVVYAFWQHYDVQNSDFQLAETVAWVPQIGLHWSLSGRRHFNALSGAIGFSDDSSDSGILESDGKALAFLLFDAGNVQRSDWGFLSPGYSSLLPDVGARVGSGLCLDFDLGRSKTSLCSDQVYCL